MPTYRDDAIVLRTHLLGESDKIVTLLGRKRGKIRAVAKGIRKTTSRFGARLEPFNQVDAMFYEGKSLDIIQQAESLGSHSQAIGKDYGKYTCAMVMVETADKLTDHDYQPSHYSLLLGGLRALAAGDHDSSLIVDSYLLRALGLAGWSPSLDSCAVTGDTGDHSAFAVSLGGVVSDDVAPPGSPRLRQGSKTLLQALIEGEWPVAEAADSQTRAQVSGLIAAYTQYHLERHVKSLAHLDRTPSKSASKAVS
jgi:DNA repair protein RecO (recombination protein O)